MCPSTVWKTEWLQGENEWCQLVLKKACIYIWKEQLQLSCWAPPPRCGLHISVVCVRVFGYFPFVCNLVCDATNLLFLSYRDFIQKNQKLFLHFNGSSPFDSKKKLKKNQKLRWKWKWNSYWAPERCSWALTSHFMGF